MATLFFGQYDSAKPLAGTLEDKNGPIDLTGASVAVYIQHTETKQFAVNGLGSTVTNPTGGKVSRPWASPNELAVPGIYSLQHVITFSDGSQISVPLGSTADDLPHYDTLIVNPRL